MLFIIVNAPNFVQRLILVLWRVVTFVHSLGHCLDVFWYHMVDHRVDGFFLPLERLSFGRFQVIKEFMSV